MYFSSTFFYFLSVKKNRDIDIKGHGLKNSFQMDYQASKLPNNTIAFVHMYVSIILFLCTAYIFAFYY